MHGFAEYHSWESKQKGLAGMSENVKRGFRAGGRAPYGYRLRHVATGAMRDGQDVTKSKLEIDDTASAIGHYLKLRAAGVPRRIAKRQANIDLKDTTLIGIEWNALTYAGFTVWNVHAERIEAALLATPSADQDPPGLSRGARTKRSLLRTKLKHSSARSMTRQKRAAIAH
jgi:hypothetical protein